MPKMQRWYIGDGDERRTTMARTKKEAASMLGVSQYSLDRSGGILDDNGTPPPPSPTDAPPSDAPPTKAKKAPAGKIGSTRKIGTPVDPNVPPAPPVRIITNEAEVAKLDLDTWDGIINLESWNGLKKDDPVRLADKRGNFTFKRYYKSATQEYVEVLDKRNGGVRPVRPETVTKIEPAGKRKRTSTKGLEDLLP